MEGTLKTKEESNRDKLEEIATTLARQGHWDQAKVLFDTDPTLRTDPSLASRIVGARGQGGKTFLMHAAAIGDLDRFNFLLAAGADPRAEDDTFHSVLYYAAAGGNHEIIEALLQQNVDINYQDQRGNSALHYAAAYGDIKAVQSLVWHGAMVNQRNQAADGRGNTPLMQVLKPTHVNVIHTPSNAVKADIIKILCNKGSNIHMRNSDDLTSLSIACSIGNVEAVRILCEYKSVVNAIDFNGSTPLILLIHNVSTNQIPPANVEAIVDILLSYGADPDIQQLNGLTVDAFISGLENPDLKNSLTKKLAEGRMTAGGAAAGMDGGRRRKTRGRGRAKAKAKGKAKAKAKGTKRRY
jgi:ankyrin repeat protein